MKKSLLPVLITVFVFISAPLPMYAQASQTATDGLNAAMERADNARILVIDFEGPSYFPGEWEAAEVLHARAGEILRENDDNVKGAADAYNAAADSFEAIFALTAPLYAQAREDEIMAVRGELIAAGARVSFPEYFTPADQEAILAYDQYEAKEYYPAKETAAGALEIYEGLAVAYDAWLIRQGITERGFENYDPDSFNNADELLIGAMDAYAEKNIAEMREKAGESLEKYRIIHTAGWLPYVELRFSCAETERQNALDNKADVAIPDIFVGADSIYTEAVNLFESQDYENAAKGFIRAESLFVAVIAETLGKRLRAAEAIEETEEKIEESRQRQIAVQAEINR